MFIGNKYADNKLYRGLKHYDHLPLTSEDIHESSDINYRKASLVLDNIVGSGTLNEPLCSISSTGISLNTPAVLLIEGDISLIQSTGDIISSSEIESSGYTDGLVCIVGWYQSLTSTSTLREYGGVRNDILENDLLDNPLKIQVSTRYQLRWDVVVVDKNSYDSGESMSITLLNRDANGEVTSGTSMITTKSSLGFIRTADKPTTMDYAVSDLYIAPIIKYHYEEGVISGVEAVKSIKPAGGSKLIISAIEPTGKFEDGAIWYNPDTSVFKFYVSGLGFLAASSEIALMQYNNTARIEEQLESQDIEIDIGIPSYEDGDILQVIYNGVVVDKEAYSINAEDNKIKLLRFSSDIGDSVTFLVTKLVNTNTATTIAAEFNSHVSKLGDSSKKGHLSLSDTANQILDTSMGIAATPKSVYDATTIIDTATNKKYRLKVTNGTLGIVEV